MAADAPKVFVSYAHESDEHKEQVLAFATFLRQAGIDAVLDLWSVDARRDWYAWAIQEMTGADFVLVVASGQLRRLGDGSDPNLRQRGTQSEVGLLRDLVHADRATWLPKILPVVLPGHAVDQIPLFLHPHTATHFLVSSFTIDGAEELLRVIVHQPVHILPAIGPGPVLPAMSDDRTLGQARPQILIEHTFDVADAFVDAVRRAVSMAGWDTVAGPNVAGKSTDADVIITIEGFGYGQTEPLFLSADQYGTPRLVFLLDQRLATTSDERQSGFRTRLLGSDAVSAVVDTPDALAAAVTARLGKLRPSDELPQRVRKIPPRREDFTGRESELEQLREMLTQSPSSSAAVTITGEAGVGKTQLALEYAHRFADEYDVVWWVPALSEDLVTTSFLNLYWRSGEPYRHSSRLLIADGASDPDVIRGLTPPGDGHTIITSRESSEDNCLLIKPNRHSAPDPKSWWATIEQLDDPARHLATLSAWIAPTPVSISLLVGHPSCLTEPLRSPEGLAAAAAALRQSNLVTVDTDTVTMHGLLAEWLRDLTKFEELRPGGWPAIAVELLSHADSRSWRGKALRHALSEVSGKDRPMGPQPEVIGQLLDQLAADGFPKSQTLSENASRYFRGPVATRERTTVERLRAEQNWAGVAAAARELGDYNQALHLDEEHLAELTRTYGDNHPSTLAQAVSLATTLRDLGHHQRAHDLAGDTLTRARRALGDDAPVTLAAVLLLAANLRETGDFQRARELDTDLLERCESQLGPYHPRTLQASTALACDMSGLGAYEQARDLNLRTLDRCRRVLGEDHPDTLACALNLAADYAALNEPQLAHDLGKETLRRYSRTLGDDHPDTRRCAANLNYDLGELTELSHFSQQLEAHARRRARDDAGHAQPHAETYTKRSENGRGQVR